MLRIGASYVRNTNRVGAFEPLDISPISSGRKGAWDWVQCMANDWINHTPIMKLQQKFRSPHLGELPDWWYTCMCQEHDASWGHWSVLCCCRCPRWFSPKFRIHVISSFFSMLILFDSFSSSYLIVLLRKFSKAVFSMQLLPFHHTLLFFFYHKKNWNWGLWKGRLLWLNIEHTMLVFPALLDLLALEHLLECVILLSHFAFLVNFRLLSRSP